MNALTHSNLWETIDKIAHRHNLSPSGLARKAGLDPTALNKSKRYRKDGKEHWPSMESIAKILNATNESITIFSSLISSDDILLVPKPQDISMNEHCIPEQGIYKKSRQQHETDIFLPIQRNISSPSSGFAEEQNEILTGKTTFPKPYNNLDECFVMDVSNIEHISNKEFKNKTILYSFSHPLKAGQAAILKLKSEQHLLFVRIDQVSENCLTCGPTSDHHQNQVILRDEIEYCAPILWVSA